MWTYRCEKIIRLAFRKFYFRHASNRDVNVQQCATAVVTQLKIMSTLQYLWRGIRTRTSYPGRFTTFINLHEETACNHIGRDSYWVLLEWRSGGLRPSRQLSRLFWWQACSCSGSLRGLIITLVCVPGKTVPTNQFKGNAVRCRRQPVVV